MLSKDIEEILRGYVNSIRLQNKKSVLYKYSYDDWCKAVYDELSSEKYLYKDKGLT